MPEVPAGTAPAVATPASTQVAPATQDGVHTPDRSDTETVQKAFNASQMSLRIVKELQETVADLKGQLVAKPPEVRKPAGVEEQLASLQRRLDESEANAAKDRLNAAMITAASEHKVASERMDYLEFKLRKEHGEKLTANGVPDPTAPGAMISISTLVAGLLSRPEGAVFKMAPAAVQLPAGTSSAPTVAADGVPEFTIAQFEKGLIPKELRKAGAYRVKEER
jgi:hypothetical protein